jgi:hypothetical protein
MAASLITVAQENARQILTGDDRFYTKKPYAFVLRGPAGQGSLSFLSGYAVFPLPINPEVFEYSLPFAAQITPGQENGIIADEQGIVIGNLRISGTTGFKVRPPLDNSYTRGGGEFGGDLDSGSLQTNLTGLSGQMQFWRLANRCFDAYSHLKKDQNYASQTSMEFHSMKDHLHLLIIPREFTLLREASRHRVTYHYTISASVIGAANSDVNIPSPDVGLLQGIKNTISQIRTGVQGVNAAINDVTASIDDLRRTITSIASVIDDVKSINESFEAFLSGAKKFIESPKDLIASTAALVESTADVLATVVSFPADVAQTFRKMGDELDRLSVAAANHFRDTMQETLRKYNELAEGPRTGKDPARDQLNTQKNEQALTSQGRMSIQQTFGEAVKPGDKARAQINMPHAQARFKTAYTGFEERIIGHGDTLQSLAAKYMGNARDWPLIAAANQLSSPYITNGAKIPNTVQVGQRITIPVARLNRRSDVLTTGERITGNSQMEAHLGRDIELRKLQNGQYGWAIDVAGGSVDIHYVQGMGNLEQALAARLRTEKGTNILYPNIGLPRLVGTKAFNEQLAENQYEARLQLLADTRVASVASFRFDTEEDVITIEAEIVPIGETAARAISRTLT